MKKSNRSNSTEPLTIFDFHKTCNLGKWKIVNDAVMGGLSKGTIKINQEGNGVFTGHVSLDNNGGFTMATYNFEPYGVKDYSNFVIRLKGDGKKYRMRCKSNKDQQHSYTYPFIASKDWKTIVIPFKDMQAVYRGNFLKLPNFKGDYLTQIAFLIGNKVAEDFTLEIDYIKII